jgi:hypothetical protein
LAPKLSQQSHVITFAGNIGSKMKAGDKTIIKCEIICPFCIERTGKWKLIKLVPKKYEIVYFEKDTFSSSKPSLIKKSMIRKTMDAPNEQEMILWERKVLQEHLDKCSMKDYLSSSVLDHYQLKK